MKQLLFCLTLSASAAAFANPIGVSIPKNGMAVKLISSENIQMAEEEVCIKLPPIGRISQLYAAPAEYICKFKLKNLTDGKVSAKIGFPLGKYTYYDKSSLEKVYQFSASKDGKPYNLEYYEGDDGKKYSSIFSWDMEFAPLETAYVDLSYKMPGIMFECTLNSHASEAQEHLAKDYLNVLNRAVGYMFFYITETGKGWSGNIEKATFTVDASEFEKSVNSGGDILSKKYTDIITGKEYDETSEDTNRADKRKKEKELFEKAVRNGHMIVDALPGQWETIQEDGIKKLRLCASPFNPDQGGIRAGCYFTVIPKTADTLDIVMQYALDAYKSSWQYMKVFDEHVGLPPEPCKGEIFKNVADVILEFYGIDSGNEDIKYFVKKQVWHPVKEPKEIDAQLKEKLLEYSAFKK